MPLVCKTTFAALSLLLEKLKVIGVFCRLSAMEIETELLVSYHSSGIVISFNSVLFSASILLPVTFSPETVNKVFLSSVLLYETMEAVSLSGKPAGSSLFVPK